MFDLIKLGFYILFFIPGFIFVQTKDYHLLRENKSQFEKTLEIVLWNAILWCIAFVSPFWFPSDPRHHLINLIDDIIKNKFKIDSLVINSYDIRISFIEFFISLCFYTFIFANFWGYIRKSSFIDNILRFITGRDWYPSVKYKFIEENINKVIEFKIDNNKYIGIMLSAPDNQNDKHIIVENVILIQKNKLIPLNHVKTMLINYNEISEIKAYKDEYILKKGGKK